ncbi:hypothetical protein [Altibacter sp. HG106]|uniref:hypothetical protein n=1 Tax=Altibacter sp. HG106 TaxID=3023937 RepID=UPI002350B3E5|nr:hypothetical protein [Altibacter sp. HG106]MDC7993526.1 hypothetical protein [Altibacter sp. HG106]
MKNHLFNISTFLLLLALTACKTNGDDRKNKDATAEERLYLGQKPPGPMPEPFAPGIVTTQGWEYGGAITPDLKEFYFIREVIDEEGKPSQQFVLIQDHDGEWKDSVISARVGQPIFSPDGKTMHLGRRYKNRNKDGEWSEIKELPAPFDTLPIMRLSASKLGTYVFDERDTIGTIQYSVLKNGVRQSPKAFGEEINSGSRTAHPFIAPDETYLIWDSEREDGKGNSDIYISFRQQDGSWGKALNLGDRVNTEAWEAAASVTPDGKYLFFHRNMGSDAFENADIFWVSTEIIEDIRPKN